ncbi:MAG TPA: epoxyqueuosine reductase QueH [Clostridiaceae bacterium]|nr:epoxyqueuosine reductase QueH [Clostridiaceae bacterium]
MPSDPDKIILVHTCCGPCAEYPTRELLTAQYQPTLLYYNPNIQPQIEWRRRCDSLRKLADLLELELIVVGSAETEKWELMRDKAERCRYCYNTRLRKAARYARDHGFTIFTTTLLVSPYQDREQILALGHKLASQYKLDFFAADWRPGFRAGQQMAKDHALYRQRYCGCVHSLSESKFKDKILTEHLALENDTVPFD